MLNQPRTIATDRHALGADKLGEKEEQRTPWLALQKSSAAINQPLPLGIVLKDSTGEETVVLNGLVEGTSLSAGSALSETRWSVPGRDLDKAFISAPENFDGIMPVTVTLYSSRHEILETQEVRFEWSSFRKGDKLPITLAPFPHLAN